MPTSSPHPRSGLRALALSLACAAAVTTPISAEIIGSFVLNADGTVTYTYQVDNTAGLFDIAAWSLEFDFASPDWIPLDSLSGGDVDIPNALWFADAGIPILGSSAQDFLSLDPAGDVLVGDLLAGFSFTSHFQPGTVTFHEFSAIGDSFSGSTVGPVAPTVAVPEGGTWIAGQFLVGLAAWGLYRRRQG